MKHYLLIALFALTPILNQAQKLNTLAQDFINTLTPELKEKALFTLNSDERFDYNYVPLLRDGPTFNDFNDKQKNAAITLLKASLSKEGYKKTTEIMALESVLKVMENNSKTLPDGSPKRDNLNYHFSVFGKPDTGDFWGWRFEGHHLSLNFLAENGVLKASTPSFMGTNPGIVRTGEQKGKEVLKQEAILGFKLVHSLSQKQLKVALFSETAPADILTTNKRRVGNLAQKGILYTALTKTQKAIFDSLLEVYLSTYESNFSANFKEKIVSAGIDKLSFAWAGSLKPGAGHYYSIQGPMLLIEYDNTQDNANHAHAVVRDLTNDFGQDVLHDHYKKHHH